MDLERRTDFGASDWAHGAIPNQGLVDPGTIPQLVSGCQGMSITTQNYLIHWQSHADYRSAWEYIHADLGIEHYAKIYTSQHFQMHPTLEEEPINKRLDFLVIQIAIVD